MWPARFRATFERLSPTLLAHTRYSAKRVENIAALTSWDLVSLAYRLVRSSRERAKSTLNLKTFTSTSCLSNRFKNGSVHTLFWFWGERFFGAAASWRTSPETKPHLVLNLAPALRAGLRSFLTRLNTKPKIFEVYKKKKGLQRLKLLWQWIHFSKVIYYGH